MYLQTAFWPGDPLGITAITGDAPINSHSVLVRDERKPRDHTLAKAIVLPLTLERKGAFRHIDLHTSLTQ
jgi:hypothetical protein